MFRGDKMKVKQLKKLLEKCDDNDEVVMSTDEEGNSFSPLSDIEKNMVYIPMLQEIKLKELNDDLIEQGFSDDDISHDKDGLNCVVLYPK
jgi:hypothetical protein